MIAKTLSALEGLRLPDPWTRGFADFPPKYNAISTRLRDLVYRIAAHPMQKLQPIEVSRICHAL